VQLRKTPLYLRVCNKISGENNASKACCGNSEIVVLIQIQSSQPISDRLLLCFIDNNLAVISTGELMEIDGIIRCFGLEVLGH